MGSTKTFLISLLDGLKIAVDFEAQLSKMRGVFKKMKQCQTYGCGIKFTEEAGKTFCLGCSESLLTGKSDGVTGEVAKLRRIASGDFRGIPVGLTWEPGLGKTRTMAEGGIVSNDYRGPGWGYDKAELWRMIDDQRKLAQDWRERSGNWQVSSETYRKALNSLQNHLDNGPEKSVIDGMLKLMNDKDLEIKALKEAIESWPKSITNNVVVSGDLSRLNKEVKALEKTEEALRSQIDGLEGLKARSDHRITGLKEQVDYLEKRVLTLIDIKDALERRAREFHKKLQDEWHAGYKQANVDLVNGDPLYKRVSVAEDLVEKLKAELIGAEKRGYNLGRTDEAKAQNCSTPYYDLLMKSQTMEKQLENLRSIETLDRLDRVLFGGHDFEKRLRSHLKLRDQIIEVERADKKKAEALAEKYRSKIVRAFDLAHQIDDTPISEPVRIAELLLKLAKELELP